MWALARKVKNIFKSCVFMSCVFLLISCFHSSYFMLNKVYQEFDDFSI